MQRAALWGLWVVLWMLCGASCRACPRGPDTRRSAPPQVVAVCEAGELWTFAYAAEGAWLAHELSDDVRLWRHRGGAKARWTRRGRRLLLNGRQYGVDLTGLSGVRAARWLRAHDGWERWVVLDGRALTPQVVRCLRRVRSLGLALVSPPGNRPPLRRLSVLADGLVALSLKGALLSGDDVTLLAGLRRLQALSLAGARLGAGAAKRLRLLSSVRLLDLTDVGVRELGFVRSLGALRQLLLAGTRVTDVSLEALEGRQRLRVLDLSRTAVSDFGVDRLTSLSGLRSLDLSDTGVTDLGVDLVAGLVGLRVLRLGPNITDPGLGHLADLPGLRVLALRRTGITAAGLARLAALRQLVSLDLAWTDIGDPALHHLRGLTRLRHLDLGRTRVSGQGLAHLAGIRRLTVVAPTPPLGIEPPFGL